MAISPYIRITNFLLFGWAGFVIPFIAGMLCHVAYIRKRRHSKLFILIAMTSLIIAVPIIVTLSFLIYVQNGNVIIFPDEIREAGGYIGSLATEWAIQFTQHLFNLDPVTTVSVSILLTLLISLFLSVLFTGPVKSSQHQGTGRKDRKGKNRIINNYYQ